MAALVGNHWGFKILRSQVWRARISVGRECGITISLKHFARVTTGTGQLYILMRTNPLWHLSKLFVL